MTNHDNSLFDSPRDHLFNPNRLPKTDRARNVIAEIRQFLVNYEDFKDTRKRQRRSADAERWDRIITALLCDLIYRHLATPGQWIAVPLSKATSTSSRYARHALGKQLPRTIRYMAADEMDWLEVAYGQLALFDNPARVTTIRASERLIQRIVSNELQLDDFIHIPEQEIIILKRARENWHDVADRLEYEDTKETCRYRTELRAINQWLEPANISVTEAVTIDLTNRGLSRYFTMGSFQAGGRLFGGFWQTMRKADRHHLRINGEQVVTLDFGQMVPRIAYSLVSAIPPLGDAYTVLGFEEHRAGIKRLFNAMLFTRKPLSRFPQGTKELFRKSVKLGDVVERIVNHHPHLSSLFYTGAGHQAQYIESSIMITLLIRLMDKGIVALPIHDAVVVPVSNQEEATSCMKEAFTLHTGIEAIVDIDD